MTKYWLYECSECGDVTVLEGEPIEDICPSCEEESIIPVRSNELGMPLPYRCPAKHHVYIVDDEIGTERCERPVDHKGTHSVKGQKWVFDEHSYFGLDVSHPDYFAVVGEDHVE